MFKNLRYCQIALWRLGQFSRTIGMRTFPNASYRGERSVSNSDLCQSHVKGIHCHMHIKSIFLTLERCIVLEFLHFYVVNLSLFFQDCASCFLHLPCSHRTFMVYFKKQISDKQASWSPPYPSITDGTALPTLPACPPGTNHHPITSPVASVSELIIERFDTGPPGNEAFTPKCKATSGLVHLTRVRAFLM